MNNRIQVDIQIFQGPDITTPVECHTYGGNFREDHKSDLNVQSSYYIIFAYCLYLLAKNIRLKKLNNNIT